MEIIVKQIVGILARREAQRIKAELDIYRRSDGKMFCALPDRVMTNHADMVMLETLTTELVEKKI